MSTTLSDEEYDYNLAQIARLTAERDAALRLAEERRLALLDIDGESKTARAFNSDVTLIRDQLYRIEGIVREVLAAAPPAGDEGGTQ